MRGDETFKTEASSWVWKKRNKLRVVLFFQFCVGDNEILNCLNNHLFQTRLAVFQSQSLCDKMILLKTIDITISQ